MAVAAARPAWAGIPQPTTTSPAAGPGWAPGAATRVLAGDDRLTREAERLGAELTTVADRGDGAKGLPGDVLLRLGPVPGSAADGVAEAYCVEVGPGGVTVTGTDVAGVFRGTRQVLHTLRARGGLPSGSAVGVPAVPERGLHLDAARVRFRADWIAGLLRELAYVGLNLLQWHVSEDEGFGIESLSHPEVASPGALSRAEVRALLDLADDLHVRVAPSLAMPGHLGQVLRAHPDLRLRGADGAPVPGALDVTDERAVRLALDLVDELAGLFRSGVPWNIGADELLGADDVAAHPGLAAEAVRRFGTGATGADLLVDFVNRVAAVVRSHGYRPQVWNDAMFRGAVVPLDRDVRVACWTGWHPRMAPLSAALDRGHDVLNAHDALLYYVLGEHAGYAYPTAERLAAHDWHPGLFAERRLPPGPDGAPRAAAQVLDPPYPPQLRGAMAAIWCDVPGARTPDQVAEDVRAPLRAMAERAWNAGTRLGTAGLAGLDRAIGAAVAPATADPKG